MQSTLDHPLKMELKSRVAQNIGEVLQVLQLVFARNQESQKEAYVHASNWQHVERSYRTGTIGSEEYFRESRKLTSALIELISSITDEEADLYELQNAIFQRILVVCRNPDRVAYMRKLFPENIYKELDIDSSGIPKPKQEAERYDLIIFDNADFSDRHEKPDLLMYYLDNTDRYLLYFGKQLDVLYDYSEKAYFTNSPFSIHARLDEMIRYVKYSRKNLG